MEIAKKESHLPLITAIALGTLLNPLNTSMFAVAVSRIQQDFQLDFSAASWLISVFYLVSAICQPLMGKISDLYGRRRIFLSGLVLVVLSSALAPFSPNFAWLIVFRMIQAFGSSALYPAGMGILRSVVKENQASALGVMSIFSSVSAAFGPSLGGVLIHAADWPAIFFVNFPVILASFTLALKVLPPDRPERDKTGNIDFGGVVLFSLMIFCWLWFLLSASNGVSWWKAALAVMWSVWFYRYESGKAQPFIDVLFLRKNMNVTLVYVQFILINIIFYSIFFGIPIYLQNVMQFDASRTGLIMLSIACFGVIVSPAAGRWIDRSGPKPPLVTGGIILIAGTLLLLTVNETSREGWVFFVLSVLGISNGLNNLGTQTTLFTFVAPRETGIASGLYMTSRFVGTIFSSSLLAILFGKTITTGHLHGIAIICALIGAAILLLSIRLPQVALKREKAEDQGSKLMLQRKAGPARNE